MSRASLIGAIQSGNETRMDDELKGWVRAASDRPEIRQAILAVYEKLEAEVATQRPLCVLSGRCCRFDEFGHRLFVTTMELAVFLSDLPVKDWPTNPAGCPFQVGKMCGVHGIRPFGCRMFFCDETSTDWQRQAYERFHGEIKRLHETHQVPYVYLEWRDALRKLQIINA
jgi:Fe-S-cluster containining protein